MEEQLHIPGKSSNLAQKKQELLNNIKQNIDYIYVALMVMVNILTSLITIEDGKIGLNFPHSILGWCLWVLRMILQTAIGVNILGALRRHGIKNGHIIIKETYDAYKKAIAKDTKFKPRSLKEYMMHYAKKDTISKSLFYIMSGFVLDSVMIGANLNNLVSLVVTTISAIAFGLSAMVNAEEFVTTELVLWYQLKIAEVTDHKLEPAKEENECITTEGSGTLNETIQDKLSSTEEKM